MENYEFQIDAEFEQLMFPRTGKAYRRLRRELLNNKVSAEVTVWNNTIVNGIDEYKIAKEHNLAINYHDLKYLCRDKVIAWICEQTAKRSDITKEVMWYCVGKQYELERVDSPSRKVPLLSPPDEKKRENRSSLDFSIQYNISRQTIYKYWAFAMAIDYAFETTPELAESILSGSVAISQDDVGSLIELDAIEMQQMYEHLVISKQPYYTFNDELKKRKRVMRNPHSQKIEIPTVSVKNMPQYDPDAELSSLCLTIPSWISSIERVKNNLKIDEVSNDARIKTYLALDDLMNKADEMQEALRGRKK